MVINHILSGDTHQSSITLTNHSPLIPVDRSLSDRKEIYQYGWASDPMLEHFGSSWEFWWGMFVGCVLCHWVIELDGVHATTTDGWNIHNYVSIGFSFSFRPQHPTIFWWSQRSITGGTQSMALRKQRFGSQKLLRGAWSALFLPCDSTAYHSKTVENTCESNEADTGGWSTTIAMTIVIQYDLCEGSRYTFMFHYKHSLNIYRTIPLFEKPSSNN